MTISSNIHGATEMLAEYREQTSWLKIKTPSGHAVVFMPLDVAQATARAFNAAMDWHVDHGGKLTLADFVSAQPDIQEQAQ